MLTYKKEIEELEKKSLEIRRGSNYIRKHDKKQVKVIDYDDEYIKITDYNGNHFVRIGSFNCENFMRDGN